MEVERRAQMLRGLSSTQDNNFRRRVDRIADGLARVRQHFLRAQIFKHTQDGPFKVARLAAAASPSISCHPAEAVVKFSSVLLRLDGVQRGVRCSWGPRVSPQKVLQIESSTRTPAQKQKDHVEFHMIQSLNYRLNIHCHSRFFDFGFS